MTAHALSSTADRIDELCAVIDCACKTLSNIHGSTEVGNIVILRDVTSRRESVELIVVNSTKEFRFDDLLPGRYCLTTHPAMDVLSHWSPESGCSTPIIELAAGESKEL